MNIEIIALARGSWCGCFGMRSYVFCSRSGLNGSSASTSQQPVTLSSQDAATEPRPKAEVKHVVGSGDEFSSADQSMCKKRLDAMSMGQCGERALGQGIRLVLNFFCHSAFGSARKFPPDARETG